MTGHQIERLHRIWTTPVIGFVWAVNVVFEWRDRRVRSAWNREMRDVEKVAARIARCDLQSDLNEFGRKHHHG